MMKNLLILGVVFLLSTTNSDFNPAPLDWTLLKSEEGVNVYYKLAECDFKSGLDSKWYLLKYENTTKENIELNFHKLIYEGDVCKTCDYPKEYSYSVFLESNQVKAGKCLKNLEPAFYVFSDFIDFPVDNPTLKFELANFKVTKHRSQK